MFIKPSHDLLFYLSSRFHESVMLSSLENPREYLSVLPIFPTLNVIICFHVVQVYNYPKIMGFVQLIKWKTLRPQTDRWFRIQLHLRIIYVNLCISLFQGYTQIS